MILEMEYEPVLSPVFQRLLAWPSALLQYFFLCVLRPKAQVQISSETSFLFFFFFFFCWFSFLKPFFHFQQILF